MTQLPDDMLFDDESRNIANSDLKAFLDKYPIGQSDFPEAKCLSFACGVLCIMAERPDDSLSFKIVGLLDNPKVVTYSKLHPLIETFLKEINLAIDQARDRRTKLRNYQHSSVNDVPF